MFLSTACKNSLSLILRTFAINISHFLILRIFARKTSFLMSFAYFCIVIFRKNQSAKKR